LKNLKSKLKHWNNFFFGNIFQAKWVLKLFLEQIQSKIILKGFSVELEKKKTKFKGRLKKENNKRKLYEDISHASYG